MVKPSSSGIAQKSSSSARLGSCIESAKDCGDSDADMTTAWMIPVVNNVVWPRMTSIPSSSCGATCASKSNCSFAGIGTCDGEISARRFICPYELCSVPS